MLSFRAKLVATPSLRLSTRLLSTQAELPSECSVAIVGGGVIGTSIAYHLAKAGMSPILLEKNKITSGTTWHAAGLMVTFGSLSHTSTEMRKYSKHLYSSVLEEETGLSTGFKGCGFIEVATDSNRLEEYRRIAAFNRYCGIDVQEITPSEVKVRTRRKRQIDVSAVDTISCS